MRLLKKVRPLPFGNFLRSLRDSRRFKRLAPEKRSIVFYSESGQDWHHFEPVIKELTSLSRSVCYVTSDPADAGLSFTHQGYLSFYIRPGFQLIFFFQFLQCTCLVLTMIDLGIFHLKRSMYPVHYIYLFHSMGSTHMVDFENSYDHYDTILCVGPHQVVEIRKREQLKGLPAKNLVEHGYARVEQLMAEAQQSPSNGRCVLLAPTWGDNSILNLCGGRLVGILLDAGYYVILRPHYQTVKLTPQIVEAIVKTYGGHANFQYVNAMGEKESLYASHILICDWSSMSIEYALGLQKPVLYIDVPKRVRNPHYAELGLEPLEISIREQIGAVLALDKIDEAPRMIESLLRSPEQFREKIETLRKQIIFNLGHSALVGAREIAALADKRR